MNGKRIVEIIGVTEIVIAVCAVTGLFLPLWLPLPGKPVNVFIFVLLSAVLSFTLGLGLLRLKEKARSALIFFSGYVILAKILVFSGLLVFTADVVTVIPAVYKNLISVVYHGFVILSLSRRDITGLFKR